MSTCRFCVEYWLDEYGMSPTVMYGPRHYAHPDCFLAAKGVEGLRALSPYAQRNLPYFSLKRHGLLEEMDRIEQMRDEETKSRAALAKAKGE